eukprot:TRINITY_DN10918_c0_g1_i5.p1 TRINITY_DN10918_c0_g1~~TRINITY_DN10918_c0_g1_i5.p1  ORF type:complete len:430 (-),score=87.55 TRINITY_DN10918_c0_g1_i5:162-1427(-)
MGAKQKPAPTQTHSEKDEKMEKIAEEEDVKMESAEAHHPTYPFTPAAHLSPSSAHHHSSTSTTTPDLFASLAYVNAIPVGALRSHTLKHFKWVENYHPEPVDPSILAVALQANRSLCVLDLSVVVPSLRCTLNVAEKKNIDLIPTINLTSGHELLYLSDVDLAVCVCALRQHPSLSSLCLDQQKVGVHTLQALVHVIPTIPTLRALSVRGCGLNQRQVLQLRHVCELAGVAMVSEWCASSSLQTVNRVVLRSPSLQSLLSVVLHPSGHPLVSGLIRIRNQRPKKNSMAAAMPMETTTPTLPLATLSHHLAIALKSTSSLQAQSFLRALPAERELGGYVDRQFRGYVKCGIDNILRNLLSNPSLVDQQTQVELRRVAGFWLNLPSSLIFIILDFLVGRSLSNSFKIAQVEVKNEKKKAKARK